MDTFEPGYQHRSKAKLAVAVAAIIVIAGIILVLNHAKSDADHSDAATTQSTAMTTPDDTAASSDDATVDTTTSSGSYTDGTYSATSEYFVPHGEETIKVSLTVKNGVVTDSSIENSEYDHDSALFQEEFADEYKSQVVGKALSSLSLRTIAGASDTTQGFNDAVSQIRDKAQA